MAVESDATSAEKTKKYSYRMGLTMFKAEQLCHLCKAELIWRIVTTPTGEILQACDDCAKEVEGRQMDLYEFLEEKHA